MAWQISRGTPPADFAVLSHAPGSDGAQRQNTAKQRTAADDISIRMRHIPANPITVYLFLT